ncbi:DNA polymerase IV [Collinsella sp. zg1085]|uniref:DNA polymerase IV n=1 Tax=Collinsella sp. zg1085 TaxID=2844380 RepID=UPI001C0D791E|nr:DNA polymerase IV [Collinsella sp. zg1085]QWT17052.1 DNA polymerase IV [Collinsella sp. zg1085]
MKSEHTYDLQHVLDAFFGEWNGPAIGLLDLDAFFASVEQLDHPEWRGKPVIVGGNPQMHGVVSTASYEARAFGVHSAMPSAQAKRLCPHAIWTHGHFERYRALSRQVMSIVADETPYLEQVSIDEAFFDISPGRFSSENPVEIVKRISRRVAELGISCSIGLGTSKTIAKIASERDKPNGITLVAPGTEQSFLEPLPVRALSGIGSSSYRSLRQLGITTLGQLGRADVRDLVPIFGSSAKRMQNRARGVEQSQVRALDDYAPVKSVSCERTYAQDLTTEVELHAALEILGAELGRRLRKKCLCGTTITLKLKWGNRDLHTASMQLSAPSDNEHEFMPEVLKLLSKLWIPGTPVRLAGIGMTHFDHRLEQQNILNSLDSATPGKNQRNLSLAIDALHERFGNHVLGYGRERHFTHPDKHTPSDK